MIKLKVTNKVWQVCCLVLFVVAWNACSPSGSSNKRDPRLDQPGKTVFFNSFETVSDSAVWFWSGSYKWSPDTPPSGGERSLHINGGRVTPVASMVTKPLAEGGHYRVKCWGKSVNIGGFVELSSVDEHEISESVTLSIINSEWHEIQANDYVYCPPNSKLILTLNAAAVKDGAVLVDLIRIERIGELPQ
jgi:hypothetical protein